MNDSPAVSILVPVYKVEKYLSRCIESVLAQDFTDWELILVDDGSPDRCPEICDEYVRKDERIRVVHKENGGVSLARLTAFNEARGKYVVFLDSDDWLMPNALSLLYKEFAKADYDIVRCCPMRENDAGEHWLENYDFTEGEITDSEKYTLYVFHNRIAPYLHGAIFRKSLFGAEDFQRVIEENILIGEDWVINMLISPRVKRFKAVDTPAYIYYWNTNSVMTTTIRSPKYPELLASVLKDFLSHSPKDIQEAFQYKVMANYIISDFRPEVPFSKERYDKVRLFLCTKERKHKMKANIESKYLVFFHCYLFHRIYSSLYKFLFFNFVLKKHPRKLYPEM